MLMDVIIFGGQSNMQGQTEKRIPTQDNSSCYEYHFLTDSILPLTDPVGENIRYDGTCGYPVTKDVRIPQWLEDHVVGAACYGNTNLVPSFCKTYSELTGRSVVAVHAAKGSTVIAQWLPGTAGYGMLKDKARAAINKTGKDFTVGNVFFVWLQGESDAIEGNSKVYYMEKLTELAGALKADMGIERFGIIRVGRFTNDQRDQEIIDAQDEICAENSFFLMLTRIATELNLDDQYMNPEVKGYYSAEGLMKLGDEAARTLAAFVME